MVCQAFFLKNMTEIYSKIHVLYRQGIRAVVCNYFKKLKFTIKQTDTLLKTFQNILKHVNLTRSDSIKNDRYIKQDNYKSTQTAETSIKAHSYK